MRALFDNVDDSMLSAAEAALKYSDTLPNRRFVIPERSPIAQGTGKELPHEGIKQFPGDQHRHDSAAMSARATMHKSAADAVTAEAE
jgi:hypothetical protein